MNDMNKQAHLDSGGDPDYPFPLDEANSNYVGAAVTVFGVVSPLLLLVGEAAERKTILRLECVWMLVSALLAYKHVQMGNKSFTPLMVVCSLQLLSYGYYLNQAYAAQGEGNGRKGHKGRD